MGTMAGPTARYSGYPIPATQSKGLNYNVLLSGTLGKLVPSAGGQTSRGNQNYHSINYSGILQLMNNSAKVQDKVVVEGMGIISVADLSVVLSKAELVKSPGYNFGLLQTLS